MKKRAILITVVCLALLVGGILAYTQMNAVNPEYEKAVAAIKDGRYTEASESLQKLKGYKDADCFLQDP